MRLKVLFLFTYLIFTGTAECQPHPVCGESPAIKGIPQEQEEQLKIQVEGNAKLLSRLVGNTQLTGEVESRKKTITQNFPNLDKVIAFRYFQYVVCMTIYNDSSLTTPQKLSALQKINPIFPPIPEIPSNMVFLIRTPVVQASDGSKLRVSVCMRWEDSDVTAQSCGRRAADLFCQSLGRNGSSSFGNELVRDGLVYFIGTQTVHNAIDGYYVLQNLTCR